MKKLAIFAAILFVATSALNAGDIRVRHWDNGNADGVAADMTWSDGADISDNFSAAWSWHMGWDDNGNWAVANSNGDGHAGLDDAYVGWNNSWGTWHTGTMPCAMIGNSFMCDGNDYNMGIGGNFDGHHIGLNDLGGWALNIWMTDDGDDMGMSTDLSDMVGWGMTLGTFSDHDANTNTTTDSMWATASMDLGGAATLDIEWVDGDNAGGTNLTLGYAINDDLGLSIQMGDHDTGHTWGGSTASGASAEMTRFTLSWGGNWSFSTADDGTNEMMVVDYSASF